MSTSPAELQVLQNVVRFSETLLAEPMANARGSTLALLRDEVAAMIKRPREDEALIGADTAALVEFMMQVCVARSDGDQAKEMRFSMLAQACLKFIRTDLVVAEQREKRQ